MRIKILSAVFFMLMAFMYEAQGGSLQFNQVLTYNGTLAVTPGWSSALSPTYTCPAGKVWKIESKTRTPYFSAINNGAKLLSYLNSVQFQDFYTSNTASYSSGLIETSPLWLKAGDNIYFEFTNSTNNGFSLPYYLSIIEYNIVP